MHRIGLDLGTSYSKGVLVTSDNRIAAYLAVKTGYDFKSAAKKIIDFLSEKNEIEYPIYSCGYGREQIDGAYLANSEITALARAVFAKYQQALEVIDIGGQDTKYIRISATGRVEKFKLNRKCAAGTGAFLEEIAFRLDIVPEKFDELAGQATESIKLNSYCTVFAVSEILGLIKQGISLPNIILGIYNSIIKRCEEMAPLQNALVLTGGIPDKHAKIVQLFKEIYPGTTSPDLSQFLAAYGCVLLNKKQVYCK
ncbi:MAG TPA: ATPase [Bacteroidetes bacterium]|nr:ATPase [Bacteroidota bacterium]